MRNASSSVKVLHMNIGWVQNAIYIECTITKKNFIFLDHDAKEALLLEMYAFQKKKKDFRTTRWSLWIPLCYSCQEHDGHRNCLESLPETTNIFCCKFLLSKIKSLKAILVY